jgi:hypothetical protein
LLSNRSEKRTLRKIVIKYLIWAKLFISHFNI